MFGVGPSKDYMRSSQHNDLGWMGYRYGIVAMFIYLILVSGSILYGLKNYIRSNSQTQRIVHLSLISIFFVWFLYLWAEDTFKHNRLMPINMFYAGILYSYKREN